MVDKELGRGEFGVTYICMDLQSRQSRELLACKSIAVYVEDVRREVAIMSHLPKDSSTVSLREAVEDEQSVHLVMELCEGGELFDRIVSRGHYSERSAAAVTRTMMEVVQLCHRHGVIHRDLKPENSPLKPIDFGLSIFFKPESEQGVAQAILRGNINFKRDPWPNISQHAKDLVKKMLEPDPKVRLTAKQVLDMDSWALIGDDSSYDILKLEGTRVMELLALFQIWPSTRYGDIMQGK